ncbi:MAG: patatin, partial [Synergistota bacterium]|nr:patatin [Synergistota bacterium]
LSLSYNSLDDAIDPTEGMSFRMSAWWREHDTLLARCRFLGVTSFGESWRVFLKGGAIAGDVSRPYHAALLGGEEELYSRANHPLMAENAAWLSLALRRVFFKSWWGTVNVDLFGTAGQTYDNAWDRTDDVWEAGLALSIPGQMFDGRIIVVCDDQDEWTFGFTLGRPQWRWDPVPGE